jgi:hypothetical protein
MDRAGPIPRDVLAEYAERACLCRLDTYPDEQAALRRMFFESPAPTFAQDAERRREGFALYLELAGAERWTLAENNDDRYRAAIWPAFRRGAASGTPRSRALAAWAALAATNYLHDGATLLWADAGPRLRRLAPDEGYPPAELRTTVASFADGRFELPNGTIAVRPDMSTREVVATLHALLPHDDDLPTVHRAARAQSTTVGGVMRVLSVLTRLPDPDEVDPAWHAIAETDGEWQEGLARQARSLVEHLAAEPTLGATSAWLVERLVMRPHEANAASKLPDFTFRFRRELGRWRFYDHDFGWLILGHIRAPTLGLLSRDLGFCDWRPDGCALTDTGRQFVQEVFG